MSEVHTAHTRKCVVHYLPQGDPPSLTCGLSCPIDFIIDRHARVVSNFDSLWSIKEHLSRDLNIFVEGSFEHAPLSVEREQALVDFLTHLCWRQGIVTENIITHREYSEGPENKCQADFPYTECPGLYLCERLPSILEQVKGQLINLGVRAQYAAELEVLCAQRVADGFLLSGWITNVGGASWIAHDDAWRVNLGVKLLSAAPHVISEHRYLIPECGVKPGEGFAFACMVPAAFESFARLEVGLVVEDRFWFSPSGHLPLAFDSGTMGALDLDRRPLCGMRGKVVVIQLLASSSDTAPQRTRSRDLFNVEQKNFYGEAVIEGAHSLSEINRIIQTHPESDVILIDHAIELPANGWLRRLIRALYARLGIAACAGLVCDSRGIVADLGGSMYSTGYTISPGYGADISSPAVVMRRYPSFLPAGIVGIRRESLQTVGNFCEELSTLRAALIDWCYRARSIGFALNIEHSCQGIASVELMNEMKQPPISSKRDRRILLQHLRDNCPEVLNV